jgi:hypothetical protein
MLPVLLALAALTVVAAVAALLRRRKPDAAAPPPAPEAPPRPRAAVLAEAVPAPATISGEVARPRLRRPALDTLDALLAELESATVRIDGADTLDEGSVAELDGLAARLEAAAESLAAC